MQITLKQTTGNNIILDVELCNTIGSVKVKIQEKNGTAPAQQRLIFDGKLLEDLKTLNDYNIQNDSTIHLEVRARNGTKSKKCGFGACTGKPAVIIGDCRFCQKSFCSTHRLPEGHSCNNMEDCRKQAFDRNATKLNNERCVSEKFAQV